MADGGEDVVFGLSADGVDRDIGDPAGEWFVVRGAGDGEHDEGSREDQCQRCREPSRVGHEADDRERCDEREQFDESAGEVIVPAQGGRGRDSLDRALRSVERDELRFGGDGVELAECTGSDAVL